MNSGSLASAARFLLKSVCAFVWRERERVSESESEGARERERERET